MHMPCCALLTLVRAHWWSARSTTATLFLPMSRRYFWTDCSPCRTLLLGWSSRQGSQNTSEHITPRTLLAACSGENSVPRRRCVLGFRCLHGTAPSCSCHIFLLSQLTTLAIHNSLSLSLPAQDLPFSQIFPTIDSLPASGLTPRLYDWSVSSERLGFFIFSFLH